MQDTSSPLAIPHLDLVELIVVSLVIIVNGICRYETKQISVELRLV